MTTDLNSSHSEVILDLDKELSTQALSECLQLIESALLCSLPHELRTLLSRVGLRICYSLNHSPRGRYSPADLRLFTSMFQTSLRPPSPQELHRRYGPD